MSAWTSFLILAVVVALIGVLVGGVAVVFGTMALRRKDNDARRRSGRLAVLIGSAALALSILALPVLLVLSALSWRGHPPSSHAGASSASGPSGALRLRWVSVPDRDDMIGGEALRMLIPAEWQMQGGVVWRVHPAMPAGFAIRIQAPDGIGQIEATPTLGFSWGPLLGPGTFFPPGSTYLGNEVRPPVADAAEALRTVVLPRLRGKVGARVVSIVPLPGLAKAVEAENPDQPGLSAQVTAARMRIEYAIGSVPVDEDLHCALVKVRVPGGGGVIWVVDRIAAHRARHGEIERQMPLFDTAVRSVRLNAVWFNRYTQLVQALTRAQLDRIRQAGELSKIISRTNDEITASRRAVYERRQAAEDRANRQFSDHVRGVERYDDGQQGRQLELPSGYGHAWVSGNGEVIVTDRSGYNPNVELSGNWRELPRARD